MKKDDKTEEPWDVVKATRDAVVGTAEHVQILKVKEGLKQDIVPVQEKDKKI